MLNENLLLEKLEKTSSERFRISLKIGAINGIIISSILIFFYAYIGAHVMLSVNILGVVSFLIAVSLFNKGLNTIPFLLCTIYILIGCYGAAYYIGYEANFHLFAMILVPFAFVHPNWKRWAMLLYTFLLLIAFFLLIILFRNATPVFSLSGDLLTIVAIGNVVSLIFSFAFIFNYYNNSITKIEKNLINSHEELSDRNKEKGALLKEIHHRVKNNLAIIMSLLRMDVKNSEYEVCKQFTKDFETRISSIASVHNSIYRSERFDQINLKEYVTDVVKNMERVLVEGDTITVNVNAQECFVSLSDAVPCGLIINEVLSNSFKHAFAPGEIGKVNVRVLNNKDEISIQIEDNGVGFDYNKDSAQGLSIVDGLVEQIDASYSISGKNGTVFKMEMEGIS